MADSKPMTAAEAVKRFSDVQVNMPKFTKEDGERAQDGSKMVKLAADHVLSMTELPDGRVKIITVDGQKLIG